MDDIKAILANEGMKALLQKEINGPISFLENAISELKASFREELKKSKEVISSLHEEMKAHRGYIDSLNERNSDLIHKVNLLNEHISTLSPREWVENEIKKNNDRIAKGLYDSVEYRKMNDDRARSNQGSLLDFAEKQKLFELDIGIINDAIGGCRKDLNQMKVSEKASRCDNDKSREDFLDEARKLLEIIRLQADEQNKKIERIEGTVQKADKRVKQDSVDLSKDLLEKFSKFEDAFEERMHEIKYKRKNLDNELDRLEQQMLSSMQSGKSSKKLDDFMKQVSYNARQIAKIQQHLEGE